MIRQGLVAGISCTGANLEEDIFLLTASSKYEIIDDWRNLSDADDEKLLQKKMNRVTDICIPEQEAIRQLEDSILPLWQDYSRDNKKALPHEFFYQVLRSETLSYDGEPEDSWMLAAAKKDLPLFVPGWEDSTMCNIFASHVIDSDIKVETIRGGISYMT